MANDGFSIMKWDDLPDLFHRSDEVRFLDIACYFARLCGFQTARFSDGSFVVKQEEEVLLFNSCGERTPKRTLYSISYEDTIYFLRHFDEPKHLQILALLLQKSKKKAWAFKAMKMTWWDCYAIVARSQRGEIATFDPRHGGLWEDHVAYVDDMLARYPLD